MIDRLLSNSMLTLLQKSLDASALQNKVLDNNIANVDTPGFKRSEVVFQQQLKAALDKADSEKGQLQADLTNPKDIPFYSRPDLAGVEPEVVTQNSTSLRNDGNNVDIDSEMAKLAENQIFYNTVAQITGDEFSDLKSVITQSH